jgi:hypothetical protein
MVKDDRDRAVDKNPANRDPLSGAPGAHPVGVGAGAAGGAAAGAAIGAVAGPVGTALGAAIGGVAGGLAGKGAAEAVNPTTEDTYWRSNYATRPYVERGAAYDTYRPAYRYGWESYPRLRGRTFEEVEGDLARGWDEARAGSQLTWDKAKGAVRDAWHHVERAIPGDAERDVR